MGNSPPIRYCHSNTFLCCFIVVDKQMACIASLLGILTAIWVEMVEVGRFLEEVCHFGGLFTILAAKCHLKYKEKLEAKHIQSKPHSRYIPGLLPKCSMVV